jgi:hypothetical protein
MDKHILNLYYPNLAVINSKDEIKTADNVFSEDLYGFDGIEFYDKLPFNQARKILQNKLKDELDVIRKNKQPEVILIKRELDFFYSSELSEIKSSGIQRRDILNFIDLETAILKKFPSAETLVLENLTLAEQVIKFSSAKVIVAQHGASLANLIFARPGSVVLEIIPNTRPHFFKIFRELAMTLALDYRYSVMPSDHSNCDVEDIIYNLS